ncbi:hypothetical protein E3P98_02012 [Wallemia ichthyophaga]|nr:hypothetical protein E3P98_02012 [Wallemia ichthyophaga]
MKIQKNPLSELGKAYSNADTFTATNTHTPTHSPTHSPTHTPTHSPKRTSSRQMLNNALSLANTAVNLDKDNDFYNALSAYKQAMALLECVMHRVDSENKSEFEQHNPTHRRLEEARRLKIIHETYKDRIRLLEVLLDTRGNAVNGADNVDNADTTDTTHDAIDGRNTRDLDASQHSASPQQPLSNSTASSCLSTTYHQQPQPQSRKASHATTPSISIQPGSPLDAGGAGDGGDQHSNQTLTESPQRPPMNRSRSSSTNSSYKLPTRISSMASLSEKQMVPIINPSVGEGSLIQRRQQAGRGNDTEAFETETRKAFKLDLGGLNGANIANIANTANTATPTSNTAPRLRAVSQPDRKPSAATSASAIAIPSHPQPPAINSLPLLKTLSNNLYPTSEPIIPDPPSRGKPSFECYHIDPTRRPFQLMKLLAKSIREGAYISPRLYVSPQIWLDSRNVVKLHHIEVKVKSLETVLDGLHDVYSTGKRFVSAQVEDEVFLSALSELNRLLDDVSVQLAKKLDLQPAHNLSPTAPAGKSYTWTSKLSRSLGKSKAGGSGRKSEEGWLYAYVDLLNKVFVTAQVLDVHWGYLRNDELGLYTDSTPEIRSSVAKCLRHASECLANSVCKFVLADLDTLIGKWTKRAHGVD